MFTKYYLNSFEIEERNKTTLNIRILSQINIRCVIKFFIIVFTRFIIFFNLCIQYVYFHIKLK